MPAYRFGAIFLSEPAQVGAGRTDLAIELVKRGIAANPDEWRLGTDLGFLYYWRMKDYPDAAAAYLADKQESKAPPWIKLMAARIAEKGGSLETSRMIWSELYESTKDPIIKKDAEQQLQSLTAQDDEMHLDELADEYRKRFGHPPASSRRCAPRACSQAFRSIRRDFPTCWGGRQIASQSREPRGHPPRIQKSSPLNCASRFVALGHGRPRIFLDVGVTWLSQKSVTMELAIGFQPTGIPPGSRICPRNVATRGLAAILACSRHGFDSGIVARAVCRRPVNRPLRSQLARRLQGSVSAPLGSRNHRPRAEAGRKPAQGR